MESILFVLAEIATLALFVALVIGQYRLGKRIAYVKDVANAAVFDSQDALCYIDELKSLLVWSEKRIAELESSKVTPRKPAARKTPVKKEAK